MKLEKAYEGSRVSKIFHDIFDSGSGGCFYECNCGRVHFDTYNHWDWEDGELEDLIDRSKLNPDKYIAQETAIGFYSVGGMDLVKDCPCNGAVNMESLLLLSSSGIADYLNAISRSLLKEAEDIRVYRKIRE